MWVQFRAQWRNRWLGFDVVVLNGEAAAGAIGFRGAASICCVGPIAIAVLGVQGAIWAAGIKPYRFYLLAGSLVLLGLAHWSVYFGGAKLGGFLFGPSRALSRLIVWAATVLWAAAFLLQFVADSLYLQED